MADIDKAISGIKHCTRFISGHYRSESNCTCYNTLCPYYYASNCKNDLWLDSLELLQKQKEQIEELEHDLAIVEDNLRYYTNGNQ